MGMISIVIFGTITLMMTVGMVAALLWAAVRDGEMDRRANQPVEPIPAPDTPLWVGTQWTPTFEE